MMISNMRIITKIVIIGAILTSLVLIGTLKYYLTESENSRMNKELREVFVATALNLGELYADGLQSEQALRNIILNPQDEKAAQNFDKAIVEFDKVYARSLEVAKGSDIAARLEQSRTLWNQGLDVKRKIIELVKQGNSAGAVELLVKEETPKWREFKTVVLQQQEDVKKVMTEKSHGIDTRSSSAFHFNIAIFIATVAVTLALLLLLAFDLRRRLQQFSDMLRDMAQGEGDLTRKIDTSHGDELGCLADNLNLFIDKLHDIVKNVIRDSVQIVIGSNIVHDMSERVTRETDGLALQTTAVATASEEMSATSNDIACNCLQAAEGGSQAGAVAMDGSVIVQKTVNGMTRIAERVRNAATTVASLGDRSDQIGAIVGTIEDIADQTNLLALNAAIEAARAGEQGRGFAVVADEVRALAERTTRATSEISTMIRNIQNETRSAVESMEQGVLEVEQGSKDAAHSGEALQNIIDQINSVTMQISQIATAAEEQTATTTEISGNIQQITDIARNTTTSISEATMASNRLLAKAESLMGLLGKFKINEDTVLVLNRAKSAHMLFIGKIKAHLDGHQTVDPGLLPSHLTCAFGKWYQSMGHEKCGHSAQFKEIDAPHARVHDLGKKAIEAFNAGDRKRAAEFSDEMTACSKILIGILEHLEKECKA